MTLKYQLYWIMREIELLGYKWTRMYPSYIPLYKDKK